jgi:hypothetical protein
VKTRRASISVSPQGPMQLTFNASIETRLRDTARVYTAWSPHYDSKYRVFGKRSSYALISTNYCAQRQQPATTGIFSCTNSARLMNCRSSASSYVMQYIKGSELLLIAIHKKAIHKLLFTRFTKSLYVRAVYGEVNRRLVNRVFILV